MKEGFFQNLLFYLSIYIVSVSCQGPFFASKYFFLIAKVYIKFQKLDIEFHLIMPNAILLFQNEVG